MDLRENPSKHKNYSKSTEKGQTVFSSNSLYKVELDDDDLNEEEEEIKFENLISTLKKNPNSRTKKENISIKTFLENSELKQKFLFSTLTKEMDEMMMLCSKCIEFTYLKKDEILFREGDYGDKFFIIIRGSVDIVKTKEVEVTMTLFDYLHHLGNLLFEGENFIYERTVNLNFETFHFDSKSQLNKYEIFKLIKLKKNCMVSNNKQEIKEIIDGFNPELFKGNDNLGKIDINLLKSVANSEILNSLESLNLSLLENERPKRFKILEKFVFCVYEKGNYFGDYALEKTSSIRAATISGHENTYLGVIHSKDYKNFIMKMKIFMELKESEYLTNNFFNKLIEKKDYCINYFKYMIYKEKSKGDFLIDDYLKTSNNFYFIKEGEIELTFDGGLVSLIKNIKKIGKILGINYKYHSFEERYMIESAQEKSINHLKSFKVLTGGQNYIFGDVPYFFPQFPLIFESKVTSSKLKYYIVQKESIEKILEEEKVQTYFQTNATNKIKIVYERMMKIKEQFFDSKEKNAENEEEKLIKEKISRSTKRRSRSQNTLIDLSKIPDYQKYNTKTYLNLPTIETRKPTNLKKDDKLKTEEFFSPFNPQTKKKVMFKAPDQNNYNYLGLPGTEVPNPSKNAVKFNITYNHSSRTLEDNEKKKSRSVIKDGNNSMRNQDNDEGEKFVRKNKKFNTQVVEKSDFDSKFVFSQNPTAGLPAKFKIHQNSNLNKLLEKHNGHEN